MAFRLSKASLPRGAGFFLLLVAVLLVMEKRDMLPAAFRLQAQGERLWMRAAKYHRDRVQPRRSEKQIREMSDRWYQEILRQHPEMAVTFKDVPDSENGFLKLLELMERYNKDDSQDIPMPDEIRDMIGGKAPWDAAAFSKWLDENRALVDELAAVGLMPGQSVKGVDMERYKFIGARVPFSASKLLLSEARLAMEQGDEAGAMQSVKAALGFADHMDHIEIPSLLSETVAILIRLTSQKYVMKNLLSGEGGTSADLEAWQGLVGNGVQTPADLAHVFRGEWHTTVHGYLLPALLGDSRFLEVMGGAKDVPDPDAVVDSHLNYYTALKSQLEATPLSGMPGLIPVNPHTENLSPEGVDMMNILFVGSSAWSKGWTRAQTESTMTQAAFLSALGMELPVEPLTGKPFVVDRETGTLRVPDDSYFDGMKIEPVKIPSIKRP